MDWKRPSHARTAFVLLVEHLEDRLVPSVFTPSQISQAYGFNQISFSTSRGTVSGTGAGETIAIVDAYDDPNISADLQTFDTAFNLPAPPSFSVVKQSGTYANTQWASEISLDVEWAHAMAPSARIVLGEARSDSLSDLVSEVETVAKMPNVCVVSMSWNANEFTSESSFDYSFQTPAGHQGITFVASSGDNGTTTSWPASSPNVLSVGGTTLVTNSYGYYDGEIGWTGSGGGVSQFEAKPAYQGFVNTGSSLRTNPDVSYDASPSSGYYVYDTYNSSGWIDVGGTSAGAPQWAALIAIADQGRALEGKTSLDGSSQTLYALYRMAQTSQSTYFHVISNEGNGTYNQTGYDQVTGNGSPISYMVAAGLVAWNGTYQYGYVNASAELAVPAYAKAVAVKKADEVSSVEPPTLLSPVPGPSHIAGIAATVLPTTHSTTPADLTHGVRLESTTPPVTDSSTSAPLSSVTSLASTKNEDLGWGTLLEPIRLSTGDARPGDLAGADLSMPWDDQDDEAQAE